MYLNRDIYGTYKECLQCGYMLDVKKPGSLDSIKIPEAKRKVA